MASAIRSSEADEIRRKMALIRHELHEDVQGMVASAGSVTDWRYYVGLHPWAFCGAALAAGFLLVPRKRRITVKVPAAVTRVEKRVEAPPEPQRRGKGIVGGALALAGPLVLRAAQAYAANFIEQWLLAQSQQGMPPGHAPGPAGTTHGGPSPTGPPGPPRRPDRR